MTSLITWLKELFMGKQRPTTIKVRINLAKDASCWNYAIEADDQSSGPYVKAGNKIDFPKKHPTSTIEFRLQGKAGQTLDFDLADPIWIQPDTCPTAPCNYPEVTVLPSSTPNRLHVQNRNLSEVELHYRLNFVDSAGNKVHWDPIIRNGGEGGP
jgi:hypothetical protein